MNRRGTVLFVALWTLSLLSLMAVYLAMSMRSKLKLQSTLESRASIRMLSQSLLNRVIVFLNEDFASQNGRLNTPSKMSLYNNKEFFEDIDLGEGIGSVFVAKGEWNEYRYGVSSEESRIDINVAGVEVLKNLLSMVLLINEDKAAQLAGEIVAWRESAPAESDSIKTPTPQGETGPKHAPFDVPEELLLIKGMTREMFKKLEPYITVYSGGVIDFNTVTRPVLLSLGFRLEFVDEFLNLRRGPDRVEATYDDRIFPDPETFDSELQGEIQMVGHDHLMINGLKRQQRLATTSALTRIEAEVVRKKDRQKKRISCVFDITHSRILYNKEY